MTRNELFFHSKQSLTEKVYAQCSIKEPELLYPEAPNDAYTHEDFLHLTGLAPSTVMFATFLVAACLLDCADKSMLVLLTGLDGMALG